MEILALSGYLMAKSEHLPSVIFNNGWTLNRFYFVMPDLRSLSRIEMRGHPLSNWILEFARITIVRHLITG
jgi:hypothetical protein